jgi:hypothetical protein
MVTLRNLVDFLTQRVGESIFGYEYLREFEAQIETVQMVVSGTYAKPIYAKTLEKLVHCHVPLTYEYLREFPKKIEVTRGLGEDDL